MRVGRAQRGDIDNRFLQPARPRETVRRAAFDGFFGVCDEALKPGGDGGRLMPRQDPAIAEGRFKNRPVALFGDRACVWRSENQELHAALLLDGFRTRKGNCSSVNRLPTSWPRKRGAG